MLEYIHDLGHIKMNKLYKYRPLSDLLFKELRYCELYFASYSELNDPLDLSARINFKPENEDQLTYLIYFLIKTSIRSSLFNNSESGKDYLLKMIKLSKDDELKSKICNCLYSYFKKMDIDFISYDIVEQYIKEVSKKFQIEFRLLDVRNEIQRITKVFFESSYVTCFSETCTDPLMWAHYASSHKGICIEFSLQHEERFPYLFIDERKIDENKYLESGSEWELKQVSYWGEITKVYYQESPPSISFYDFSPVFENEGDCDLKGLSKSRWHGYAHELERIFSIKTLTWNYEREWRAIEINFGELKEPEERIRHYPIEAVTGVYFGIRTPKEVKNRIYKILKSKNEDICFFDCHLSDNRILDFKEWQYSE